MISVLIPVRNGESTISSAISSVISQDVSDMEILCIINGTTDNTEEKIRSFSDPRIKILKSEPGIVPALNVGLRESRGEIIARQDADDFWLPGKLHKQLTFLEKNPNIHILGTQMQVVDETGKFHHNTTYPLDDAEIKMNILLPMNPIAHPSVVYRKQILDKCAGYLALFPLAEDLDLWTRAMNWYNFANLNERLVIYRRSHNSNYDHRIPATLAAWYRLLYGVK